MSAPIIFLIIWGILAISLISYFFWAGKKASALFPDIETVKVIYREKGASGFSTKNFQTKMGGANKVLDIVVTEDELWLKTQSLFLAVAVRFDMAHNIPLGNIKNAHKEGEKITLDFESTKGESKQVVLMPKSPDDFLAAIGK